MATLSKGYLSLIKEVAKIDPRAAEWMRNEAPGTGMSLGGFECSSRLGECFVWSNTPHGHEYWKNIQEQLPRRYR